jgi:hypothetical protein
MKTGSEGLPLAMTIRWNIVKAAREVPLLSPK